MNPGLTISLNSSSVYSNNAVFLIYKLRPTSNPFGNEPIVVSLNPNPLQLSILLVMILYF